MRLLAGSGSAHLVQGEQAMQGATILSGIIALSVVYLKKRQRHGNS
jgi:hypothetical protein